MDLDSARSLQNQNWVAAAAHLLTGITVLVLYLVWPATQSRASAETFRYQVAGPTTPATCNTAGTIPLTPDQCNTEIVFQKPKAVASFNVIYGVLAFFGLTAVAHIFYATDGFGSKAYTRSVSSGWNPYRWVEYAITASIMTALIGLVDGTRDTGTLVAIVAMTAAMQFCGFTVESVLRSSMAPWQTDTITGATVIGWILFVALWFVLIYSFANLVSDVDTLYKGTTGPDGDSITVPAWIWYVVIFQLLYYASFGIVQLVHIRGRLTNPNFNYKSIEEWYIYLSYFAKLSLASGLGYGLLWRTKDCSAP